MQLQLPEHYTWGEAEQGSKWCAFVLNNCTSTGLHVASFIPFETIILFSMSLFVFFEQILNVMQVI